MGQRVAAACLRTGMVLAVLIALAFTPCHEALAAEPGVVPDLTWATSWEDQDRTAAALEDIGVGWVRLNANWADAEPAPGDYSEWWFERYDRAVDLARSAGARIVMLSYQSPSWASGSSNPETPPRDPADFARYMGYLAARYAGQIDAYEVWNEENIDRFWSTGPDPAEYTELLRASYSAIKQSDPSAKVIFGGLSTNDYEFLDGAYDAGAKGYFDLMSVHPYPCRNPPEQIDWDDNGRMNRSSFPGYREIRASMLARGDDKPIWITEFGWSTSTHGCGVSESTQADYLTRALRLFEQDPYVQVALWYNFRNNWWDGDADEVEARYGLMRTNFSLKPSYNALKSYTAATPPPVYPKPVGATPLRVSLVPAFEQCRSPNSTHRGGLQVRASCSEPRLESPVATLGTSQTPATRIGVARVDVCLHNTAGGCAQLTTSQTPDVRLRGSGSDVVCSSTASLVACPGGAGSDYDPVAGAGLYLSGLDPGTNPNTTFPSTTQNPDTPCNPSPPNPAICEQGADMTAIGTIRVTDRFNRVPSSTDSPSCDQTTSCAATAIDQSFPVPVVCKASSDPAVGSYCGVNTTANALAPGVVTRDRSAIVEVGQIRVFDVGPDGTRSNGDDRLFAVQGIFIP